ncbi:hypothetical protein V6N12_024111 [Hibiscus sabdariffa]|uniref:Transposase MuDR plant domain-containing protein n=1 Tax=Hibiscus sabdariffa TaxID=183260 RepID=A0ABR2FZN0_9ROSI
MTWVHLKVYMHLGGSFATDPTLSYVGGKVMEWDLDPDTLCYYTLCDMVKEAGYRAVNIKDATRDVTTEVSTTNEQEWVGHVSNETDATLASEDEEIRDIWVKAKHKKKNLVSDELQVEDQVTFKIHRGQRKKKVNGVTGKYKGKSDESGDETDYVDSSDLGSYDSDLEVFHGPKEFKEALAKYAIIKRFDIVYKRNESKRTRAWCKQEGCPFRIYAGLDKADGLYKIKTFKETHECSITFKNKRANYKYVGKHFLIKLRVLPKLKLNEMQKLAKEELKVDLNIGTCSRARKWAMEEINGRALYEFTRLFDYTYALRKADPIANIELMVERPTPSKIPKFRRFYDAKAPASSPVVSASSTPSIILGPTTHVATEAITQAHETTPQAQLHQDQGLFTECRASSTPIAPSYSTPYVPVTPTTNREHSLAPTQIAPSVKSTSSTNQLLMRLSTRGKQIVNGLGLYTDERTGMQILNPGFRGETVITLPKRHAKKRKESNNSDVIPISQESRDMKQTKYKPSS